MIVMSPHDERQDERRGAPVAESPADPTPDLTPADRAHRERMLAVLNVAAAELGVDQIGALNWGWGDRSGAASARRHDQRVWVRVVSEAVEWVAGDFWAGNVDANKIAGVPKPEVLAWTETRETDRCFRVEVMTHVDAPVASATPEIRSAPDIGSGWLAELRGALEVLGSMATDRVSKDQQGVTRRLREHFGDQVDLKVQRWATAHNDLHWANLTAPQLVILDWEGWGRAPYAYDAATLYCHSLLVPEVADAIGEAFSAELDTADGRRSQLLAAARILSRHQQLGDYRDLAELVRRHTDRLLPAATIL